MAVGPCIYCRNIVDEIPMATKKKATKRTKRPGVEAEAFLERYLGEPLTFGALLHAIRVGEEESLTAFGQKLGLTPAKLCDIEKGRRTVSPARAAAWARTLGYSEQQFVRLAVQQQLDEEGLGHLLVQLRPPSARTTLSGGLAGSRLL